MTTEWSCWSVTAGCGNKLWYLVRHVSLKSDNDSADVEWGEKNVKSLNQLKGEARMAGNSCTESDIDKNVRWCSSKTMQSSPSFDWSEVEAAVSPQSLFIFSLRSIIEVFRLCFISAGSADGSKVSLQSSHYRKIHWSQNWFYSFGNACVWELTFPWHKLKLVSVCFRHFWLKIDNFLL